MKHAPKTSAIDKTIQVLSLTILFTLFAIFLVFFIGVTYFNYTREPGPTTEGDWTFVIHIYFIIFSSPFFLMTFIPMSNWVISGKQKKSIKLATIAVTLIIYGGIYLAFLWRTCPP